MLKRRFMKSSLVCSQLALIVLISTLSSTFAQDCTFSGGDGSTFQPGQVSCYVSEDAPEDAFVCDFYVAGDATVSLSKYGSGQDITTFMTLTPSQFDGTSTKFTVTVLSSVDIVADEALYLIGGLPCTLVSSAISLHLAEWRSLIAGVGATTTTYLTVTFNLVNDHSPAFSQDAYTVPDLPETFPSDMDVLALNNVVVSANDSDTPNDASSKIVFSLEDYYDGSFSVMTTQNDAGQYVLSLYVEKILDYGAHTSYELNVIATDGAQSNPLTSTATVTLNIKDMDNLDPKFDYMFYSSTVPQLDGSDQVLTMDPADVHALDQDTGINAGVTYELVFSNEGATCDESCQVLRSAFSINPDSGQISIDTSIDFDVIVSRVASFAVKATQVDDARHWASSFVSVSLPPSTTTTPTLPTTLPTTTDFTGTTSECTCPEPTPCPTDTTGEPTPCPTGTTGPPTSTSTSSTAGTTASPKSTLPPQPADNLIITVQNVSIFSEINTILVRMAEIDGDDADIYTLTDDTKSPSKYFGIVSDTGEIYVKNRLELADTYGLMVSVTRAGLLQNQASLNIEVVNSVGIVVFDQIAYELSIQENVGDVQLIDLNAYYEIAGYKRTYTIKSIDPEPPSGSFTIDPTSGIISVGPNGLGREDSASYDLVISVTTDGHLQNTMALTEGDVGTTYSLKYNEALVHVVVQAINSNAPEFHVYGIDNGKLSVGISSYTSSGQDVLQLSATDVDVCGNSTIIFAMDDIDQFYINKDTGLIRASLPLTTLESESSDRASYTFDVTAFNEGDDDLSSTLGVTVLILAADEILMLNTNYSPDEFDANRDSILKELKLQVGADVRALKWEGDGAAVVKRSVRGLKADSSTTTVYLYALNDNTPLGRDELEDLLSEHAEAFESASFIVSSENIYADVIDTTTGDDNTTFIVAISCLAVLVFLVLVLCGVLAFLYYRENKKEKGLYKSFNNPPTSFEDPINSPPVDVIVQKLTNDALNQAISPISRHSVQIGSDEELRTDHDTANMLGNAFDVYEAAHGTNSDDVENPSFGNDDDTMSASRFELEDEVEDEHNDESGPSLVNVGVPHEPEIKKPEPDLDYLSGILKASNEDDDEDKAEPKPSSGVTFKETTEIISVIENVDDESEEIAQL